MSIAIKSGAKVLYQWERGVALTASTPCDILRISREDDRVTDDLYPVISGSTGTALIPDRMLTESGYLHVSRIDLADGSERVVETTRILVRHTAKPQNTASSTKEIGDMQALRMQMAALERAAREGKFDGKDGITPHIGENGNWFAGDVDLGIRAQGEKGDKGDPGDTPYVGANGNWFVGDTDTGVMAKSADVHMYADDMYTSGVLGAESFIAAAQEGTLKVETSPGVAYIKGVRRKLAKSNRTYAVPQENRITAQILRLNEATGEIGYAIWRDVAISGDISNGGTITDLDTGETLPLRSGGYYDLILCIVNLPAGATAVTQDMIMDLRGDERYCGYVKDKLAPTKVSELENDEGFVNKEELDRVENENKKIVWYGTDSSGPGTGVKNITTTTGDFKLERGNILFVKLSNNITVQQGYIGLDVDGTGMKILYNSGKPAESGEWKAGDIIGVVYNGSSFERIDARRATTETYGVVKLSSATNSTVTSDAATPYAVKQAYDHASKANTESVKHVEQSLTDAQKAQARKNIGALGEDALGAAVDDALRQAKDSGEFDGEPGDDYVLTEGDKTEIAEMAAGKLKPGIDELSEAIDNLPQNEVLVNTVAENAAALIDTALLAAIGSGVIE